MARRVKLMRQALVVPFNEFTPRILGKGSVVLEATGRLTKAASLVTNKQNEIAVGYRDEGGRTIWGTVAMDTPRLRTADGLVRKPFNPREPIVPVDTVREWIATFRKVSGDTAHAWFLLRGGRNAYLD